MNWLDMAMDLAKQFEGCSLGAYPDPVYGWRVATIGYGATGPNIVQGTVWTQAQADDDLRARMGACGVVVDKHVMVALNDEPKAALCDFIYNVGSGNFEVSTLLKKLNAGDFEGASDEFEKWNLADGKVLPGLVKRRDAEKALFLLGANLSGEPQTSTEVTE